MKRLTKFTTTYSERESDGVVGVGGENASSLQLCQVPVLNTVCTLKRGVGQRRARLMTNRLLQAALDSLEELRRERSTQ